ncbi:MAG: efflux RND transporter periplasmic adaptor subunit, partial [Marivirga sp.]|nr:efflux RND transporter periplasmic adaptor subunit [Marivirga sp.]
KVANGQKVFISLPNQDGQEIEGKIFSIGKSVDYETKTVSVRATIKDDKHILLAGMFVNAFISITDHSAKVIPVEAVVRTGEKQYIFMATDEWCTNPNAKMALMKVNSPQKEMSKDSVALSYKMVEVQTGPSSNGYVGITSLEAISEFIVVVKGSYYLMSQLKSGETVGCCAPEETEATKK